MKDRHTGPVGAMASAVGILFLVFTSLATPGLARSAAMTAPDPVAPPLTKVQTAPEDKPPGATAEPESRAAPGVPSDATSVTVDLPARLVAHVAGKAEWSSGFKSIAAAIDKVKAAVSAAGSTQAGHPFVVFLSTDDTSFEYDAMVPIAEAPKGKTDLGEGVKIGQSPQGKAIKFLHRGAYDDIESTYDLITAFLDEKGLEAQNLFIEEYLTDTREPDDPNLEVDIYVLLK